MAGRYRAHQPIFVFRKGAVGHFAVVGNIDHVREVRLSAGAKFVVMICGDIMTMPGLPKIPSAEKINLTNDGKVVGLF